MWELFRRYLQEKSGNFAVLTAVFSLPLLLGVSLAIDTQRTNAEMGNIQDALDAATLSAVTKGSLSRSERGQHAKTSFRENYSGDLKIDLRSNVTEERVTLEASSVLPTTLASMVGIQNIEVSRESTAELVKETVTCLLVLAKHNEKALVFGGDSSFNSPDCAIQVNSDNKHALWGGSQKPPIAKDICVTGGYYGRFGTHVKTECRPIEDPYAGVNIPHPGSCKTLPGISLAQPIIAASHKGGILYVQNQITDPEWLGPGNYCGGLKLDGKTRMSPGTYFITDGPLVIGRNADVMGSDVTFVLKGDLSKLYMEEGARMNITASKSGRFAGVAFYQVPSNAKWPENQSLVLSGGDLTVNGVFYFPTHNVHVQGTSVVGAKAKATSFIAHTLKIDAEVRTTIGVDHQAAGLPPLKPRTDEGARLVE